MRYSLFKVKPKRFIPDSETTLISGNDYYTDFSPKEPCAVFQGSTSLSYTWDAALGRLEFTVVSGAPNSNIFVCYELFFSTSEALYDYENPNNLSGSIVEWEPRLNNHATFNQSSKNLLFGTFSISASSLSLINDDYGLNQYFTAYDNYFNKEFVTYGIIGNVRAIINTGTIKSVKFGKTISFNLKDSTSSLDAIASLGNNKAHYVFNASDYPNGNSGRYGEAIPFAFGRVSQANEVLEDPNNTDINTASPEGIMRTIRADNSYNYILGIARDPYPASGTSVVATDNGAVTIGASVHRKLTIGAAHIKSVLAGFSIYVSKDGGSSWQGQRVYSVNGSTNQIVVQDNSGTVSNRVLMPSCYVYTQIGGPQAVYDEARVGAFVSMVCTHTSTPAGDKLIKVRPSATTVSFYPQLLEQLKEDLFIITNQSDYQQTDYVERMIDDAGFNSVIQTEAQTLSNNTMLVTHGVNRKLDKYLDVIQEVCKSNNAICYTLPNFVGGKQSMVYKVIHDDMANDFGVTIHEIYGYEILEPEINKTVAYQDMRAEISCSSDLIKANKQVYGSSAYASSDFAVNWNDLDQSLQYNTVIDDAQDSVEDKLAIFKEPVTTYAFTVDSEAWLTKIKVGDIARLKELGDKLPLQTDDLDILIIGIEKSVQNIRVTGYDFSKIS